MILTCNQCFTRYVVEPTAIYAKGRTVKCTKCGHNWVQKPMDSQEGLVAKKKGTELVAGEAQEASVPALSPEGAEIAAVLEDAKLPLIRVARTPPTPFLLKLLPLLFFIAALVMVAVFYREDIVKVAPRFERLYNIIGLYETKGLILSEVVLREEEDGIYVHGKVVNNAPELRHVPDIRIMVLDEEKRPLAYHTLPAPRSLLEHSAEFPISSRLPVSVQGAAYVTLDLGNKAELLLR